MNSLVVLTTVILVTGATAAPSNPIPKSSKLRIVGGANAVRGQFPYQVSVQRCTRHRQYCSHTCGGTIVDPKVVITAAQCIPQSSYYTLRVVAGISNLNDTNVQRQTVSVYRSTIHPSYYYQNGKFPISDIAVLFLDTNLVLNSEVSMAELPDPRTTPTGMGIFSGWGSTSGGFLADMPNTLQTVQTKIIDISTCKQEFVKQKSDANKYIDYSGRYLCTTPGTGVSVCVGDAGDPLVKDNKVLIGIASWLDSPCGLRGPTVFTNVGFHVDWIFEQISYYYDKHYFDFPYDKHYFDFPAIYFDELPLF